MQVHSPVATDGSCNPRRVACAHRRRAVDMLNDASVLSTRREATQQTKGAYPRDDGFLLLVVKKERLYPMNLATNLVTQTASILPAATRLGHVHLIVSSLERQIAFYTQVLGFVLLWQKENEAALGSTEEVLLRLTEDKEARRYPRNAGMYHLAILYPNRKELARAMARLFVLRYPNSPTDHGLSETTYLDDAEGNNIELYIRTLDRGQFLVEDGKMIVRYPDGSTGSGRDPLDVEGLLSELDEGDRLDLPLPNGTRIGHVHLYASSLEESNRFYTEILGFSPGLNDALLRMGDVGLDARQPHLVAFNTWKGMGIPPAPVGAIGMRHFSIVLPDAASMQAVVERVRAAGYATEESDLGMLVRDPSGIAVVLTQAMLPSTAQ